MYQQWGRLWGSTLKQIQLPTSKGRQINPSWSFRIYKQEMSELGILNLPQQLTYNKGVFMHKVPNNNSPNYLAQLFISHRSHYIKCRNNSTS